MCYLQGFGNVGAWASEIFQEQGGKVLAVSDAFGAVYNEQGLNVKALRKHIAEGKPLKEFPEGQDPARSFAVAYLYIELGVIAVGLK